MLDQEERILAHGLPGSFHVQTQVAAGPRVSRAVSLLFLLFAARLVTAAILVPPWQNPDEGVYFAVIRALTYTPWLDIANRRNVDVQAEILRSMAEHGWWSAYGEPVPDPLPSTFLGVPTHMGDASEAPPLYHVVMAAYCRGLRARGLLTQYYAVRLASAMMTLLTFALILRGAREWFDDTIAFYSGALVAVVPQFVVIGISVTPDPALFLAAAVVWWQAARLAARKGIVVPVALISMATGVAVFLKPLAVPLLVQVPALMFVAALFTPRGRLLTAIVVAAGVLLRLTGVLRAAVWLSPEQLTTLHNYIKTLGWGDFAPTPAYFADFSWRLFESAYLVAGWQRFYPPAWIVGIGLAIFVVLLTRGILWAWVQRGDARSRLAALAAVVFVAVQLAAIYGTKYYRPDWGAQGRFLFPAIGPFAALCALGLVRWRVQPSTMWVCLGVVALMALLDLVAWMTTLVPVYARWI
jgi:4-amino-4-deoxy-L-arabinose transferase-like glycosyltransferase